MLSMLANAVELHESGWLVEAAALYQQILAREPENTDALHLLGVLRHQEGEHASGRRTDRSSHCITLQHPRFSFRPGGSVPLSWAARASRRLLSRGVAAAAGIS